MVESERVLRDEALGLIRQRAIELRQARVNYEVALVEAHDLGIANTIIARAIGCTETAVRMYLKRRGV